MAWVSGRQLKRGIITLSRGGGAGEPEGRGDRGKDITEGSGDGGGFCGSAQPRILAGVAWAREGGVAGDERVAGGGA